MLERQRAADPLQEAFEVEDRYSSRGCVSLADCRAKTVSKGDDAAILREVSIRAHLTALNGRCIDAGAAVGG